MPTDVLGKTVLIALVILTWIFRAALYTYRTDRITIYDQQLKKVIGLLRIALSASNSI
jgi:hypothetical protein